MEHTHDADNFPQAFQKEIEAVVSLRDNVDEAEINFRKLFNEQLEEAEAWQNTDNKYCKRLYARLGKNYTLYIMCSGDPKREQLVERKCDEHKIAKTKASHLSIRLVKLMFRRLDKTAYQYASVFRYASLKHIAYDALAEELAKEGNGIAEMADRLAKEFPTKQRVAPSSDTGKRSMGPGDDDESPEPDASNDDDGDDNNNDGYEHNEDDEEEEDNAVSDDPDVDWGPKALKKWRKSELDGGALLFVKWVGENRAKIIKKSIPKS